MLEFKPRTHSDPDLPQLLPLPVRPHSSYQAKLQFKDQAQFEERIVHAMAQKLGIDLIKEGELRWVVRDCLLALKEEGWTCQLKGATDLAYLHTATEESRSFHPAVEMHRQLAERLILHKTHLSGKKTDRFWRVQQAVYEAIMGERDVRGVTNPNLMEDVIQCLGIDVQDEPYLIRRVKNAVEDSYFRMKHEGARFITIDNVINVQTLIVQLELDRVKFLRKISPSGLLYCIECETALADVACAACHDVFCNNCMVATHSTGHRMDHPAVFIEQCVCSECEQRAALVRCQDCVDLFCYDCFKNTHRYGKRSKHCVRIPYTTFCYECDEKEAHYICMECEDMLCLTCNTRMHSKGARQNHSLYGLRKAAYSKKLFANNLDRVMMIVQKDRDMALPLSPWFIFYDEAKAPYWYNFQTRERVRANPSNLIDPPESTDPATASADQQTDMKLPGATDLLSTHSAIKASEGAIFDVPPPLHIKFASPSVVQPNKFQNTAVEEFKYEIQRSMGGL
ncbi:unnamed protein product [Amoebophrya sp. A25]|nr:unnamed protein product [Amoebophrya sp. A25]|eukprot:GSA25T00000020001.1